MQMADLTWSDLEDSRLLAGILENKALDLRLCDSLGGPDAEDMDALVNACRNLLDAHEDYEEQRRERDAATRARRREFEAALENHRRASVAYKDLPGQAKKDYISARVEGGSEYGGSEYGGSREFYQ